MIDAQTLTIAMDGTWLGRYGTAPCPACQPEGRKGQNALTLTNGTNCLLAHCKKGGCTFRDILVAAGIAPGTFTPPNPARIAKRERERRAEAERKAEQAKQLWQEAQPIASTVAQTYLRGRGITCDLPPALRFHSATWHGATAKRFPAMVAMVEDSDAFAVHRTYLLADGTGKAEIEPAKAMLGATACGAVRLADGPGPLVVAEGIETALSLASGLLRTPAMVWAALSTSGIRGLRLPDNPGQLTIAPDGDTAGRAAANALATRAHSLGWQVSLLHAPDGRDWNDVLQERPNCKPSLPVSQMSQMSQGVQNEH